MPAEYRKVSIKSSFRIFKIAKSSESLIALTQGIGNDFQGRHE
jgi:hypothetical protein